MSEKRFSLPRNVYSEFFTEPTVPESVRNRWLTFKQLSELHPAWTVASLRHHFNSRNKTGLADAFMKIGRKTVVNELLFLTLMWNRSQRETARETITL